MRLPRPPAALKPWLPLGIGAMVVALLIGVAIGRFLPDSVSRPSGSQPSGDTAEESATAADGHDHGAPSQDGSRAADLEGLSLSASGFTLVPADTTVPASGKAKSWSFTITDTEGEPVTDFATVHDKKMHLFAVKRDFTGYQHLHPVMDADTGVWSTDLAFDSPGPWRVITDFAAGSGKDATAATLGTDVTVPGDYAPGKLPEPETTVPVGDFDVTMEFEPELGVSSPVLISVDSDGEPAALDRYLGAYGHLVMLRQDDVGFAHVHPESKRVGSKLRFWATLPSKGTYRAFLDFKAEGVHTAAFTITA